MFFLKKSLIEEVSGPHSFGIINLIYWHTPLHDIHWSRFTARRPYTVQWVSYLLNLLNW
jgi:hypothetical protein